MKSASVKFTEYERTEKDDVRRYEGCCLHYADGSPFLLGIKRCRACCPRQMTPFLEFVKKILNFKIWFDLCKKKMPPLLTKKSKLEGKSAKKNNAKL